MVVLALAATLVVAGCGSSSPKSTSPPVTLDGAGSSSIQPFFSAALFSYHQAHASVTVNYAGTGSSVGATDIEQGTVDFGDTEIPLTSAQATGVHGTILQLPVDLGGVAISYNLPGVPSGLHLDGPTLAEIFDGTITRWNDPRLAQATGDNSLPNLPIVAVHRADSSGPGYDFDQYLITNSPDWVSAVHTSTPSKTWPLATVGVGEQLNAGVATYIQQTSGAIGYVEFSYAFQSQFTNAALKNASGAYVAPSEAAITAAGAAATNVSATNFSIVDEPGAATYALANFSWALVYQKQTDLAKGQALSALLAYIVSTAQSQAATLGYAPMPTNEVKLAQSTIAELQGPTGRQLG